MLTPPALQAPPGARANLLGMTESFGPYTGARLDQVLPPGKEGSCGRPFAGVEVRIADVETRAPVEDGLACIELLVSTTSGTTRRWGIECGSELAVDVVRGLKPGDRVTATGLLARESARMVVQHLERPSDGYTWRAQSK